MPQECPEGLADLITRCIAKDPETRPTAKEVVDVLMRQVTPSGREYVFSSWRFSVLGCGVIPCEVCSPCPSRCHKLRPIDHFAYLIQLQRCEQINVWRSQSLTPNAQDVLIEQRAALVRRSATSGMTPAQSVRATSGAMASSPNPELVEALVEYAHAVYGPSCRYTRAGPPRCSGGGYCCIVARRVEQVTSRF